jgi:hypothetical protein
MYKKLCRIKYLRCSGNGHWTCGFGIAFWKGVVLRNTCNTLQQNATPLIVNELGTDKFLSLSKSCQYFCSFMAKKFICYAGSGILLELK